VRGQSGNWLFYLDDMLEGLVNAHPIEANVPDTIKYSSFSRLWAVMMVGGVECMIKEWAEHKPMLSDIYSYFEYGSNDERLTRLSSAFSLRGIEVDTNHFKNFLAIKYIRNAYVHGAWNENQKIFVVQRGFPDSLTAFEKEHFTKIKESYIHVMNGLGMANAFNSVLESQFSTKG
jgi:hypothetical protein